MGSKGKGFLQRFTTLSISTMTMASSRSMEMTTMTTTMMMKTETTMMTKKKDQMTLTVVKATRSSKEGMNLTTRCSGTRLDKLRSITSHLTEHRFLRLFIY